MREIIVLQTPTYRCETWIWNGADSSRIQVAERAI